MEIGDGNKASEREDCSSVGSSSSATSEGYHRAESIGNPGKKFRFREDQRSDDVSGGDDAGPGTGTEIQSAENSERHILRNRDGNKVVSYGVIYSFYNTRGLGEDEERAGVLTKNNYRLSYTGVGRSCRALYTEGGQPYKYRGVDERIERFFTDQYMANHIAFILKIPNLEAIPKALENYISIFAFQKFWENKIYWTYEINEKGIPHCHVLMKTIIRADNVRRTLIEKYGDTYWDVIRSSKVHHFRGLLRYMCKNPIAIACTDSDGLEAMEYLVQECGRVPQHKSESTNTEINPIARDIIRCMEENNVSTTEELMRFCPNTMGKYLHKTNLDAIVANCRLWVKRPVGFKKVVHKAFETFKSTYSAKKIHFYLMFQGVDVATFDDAFTEIFLTGNTKKNCLVIEGPSNTGKSCFVRELQNYLNVGNVLNSATFTFSHCVDRDLILWEEPLITGDLAETCKLVFEGMPTTVPIKHKEPRTLARTPVIVTTNKPIWHYTSVNKDAFLNRIHLFVFDRPVGELDGQRDECFEQLGYAVSRHCKELTNREPNCTDCPCFDEEPVAYCNCSGCWNGCQYCLDSFCCRGGGGWFSGNFPIGGSDSSTEPVGLIGAREFDKYAIPGRRFDKQHLHLCWLYHDVRTRLFKGPNRFRANSARPSICTATCVDDAGRASTSHESSDPRDGAAHSSGAESVSGGWATVSGESVGYDYRRDGKHGSDDGGGPRKVHRGHGRHGGDRKDSSDEDETRNRDIRFAEKKTAERAHCVQRYMEWMLDMSRPINGKDWLLYVNYLRLRKEKLLKKNADIQ